MILPDDKDPQIIFDPVSKKWIDKSANDQGGIGAGMPPPPPKIPSPSSQSNTNLNSSDTPPMMMNGVIGSNPFGAAIPSLSTGTTNAFRGGDLRRKRYVDVFNPSK
ncbi:hypothetical protein BLA29_012243 [Euroglyphus maynei]|uniref:Uncharacterized protein n=1 Tax=Euroglyphus maynei TaxID=6958 RepID=A0A1Y3BGR6_EURMA|nr:hypothetical protein BLA29_012243 [Euroglyphus maynei]